MARPRELRPVARLRLVWLVDRTDTGGGAQRLPGANANAAIVERELVASSLEPSGAGDQPGPATRSRTAAGASPSLSRCDGGTTSASAPPAW
jgi:hypothetical protein